MIRIEVYNGLQKGIWDEFVLKSRNATFLFLRDYMEYHRDRFFDHSLMLWDEDDKLIALLPANLDQNVLYSHAGLTFGGFLINDHMKMPKMLNVFEETLTHLKKQGITTFIYKPIPHIYHRSPSEEDRYALFLCNARRIRCGALAVIDNRHRLSLQERRRRGIKKAHQNGLTICQTNDFASYWEILTERLLQRHHSRPVHSLLEIEKLSSRFPGQIKLFGCFKDQGMLAGVVVYESDLVAHVQYIAANDRGRELMALDLVFDHLLNGHYQAKPYFDFGTSDERNGRYLNKGLIDQKEGFGARTVAQEQYEINLEQWTLGQKLGS